MTCAQVLKGSVWCQLEVQLCTCGHVCIDTPLGSQARPVQQAATAIEDAQSPNEN